MDTDSPLSDITEPAETMRCVVRIKTSFWKSERGLHERRDILFMRKLSLHYQVLKEDAANIGAEDVIANIVNLSECKDGLYEVLVCNERKDWETGHIEEWDYHLVPFTAP